MNSRELGAKQLSPNQKTGNFKDCHRRADCGWECPSRTRPWGSENGLLTSANKRICALVSFSRTEYSLVAGSCERFVNVSFSKGPLWRNGRAEAVGLMGQFHIPSCRPLSLPLSIRATSPPFPHMTSAVTKKPSTNISSARLWPQYILLPVSTQELGRPAL